MNPVEVRAARARDLVLGSTSDKDVARQVAAMWSCFTQAEPGGLAAWEAMVGLEALAVECGAMDPVTHPAFYDHGAGWWEAMVSGYRAMCSVVHR